MRRPASRDVTLKVVNKFLSHLRRVFINSRRHDQQWIRKLLALELIAVSTNPWIDNAHLLHERAKASRNQPWVHANLDDPQLASTIVTGAVQSEVIISLNNVIAC